MRFLSFLLTILAVHTATARTYNFSRLDTGHGLSGNQVEYIFKDSRGFMWFATSSGVNRYDGYNFKVYHHDPADGHSIPANRVKRIFEDATGMMWFNVTDSDYAAYDFSGDSFIRDTDSLLAVYGLPANPAIIDTDHKGNLYAVVRSDGIYSYDFEDNSVSYFPLRTEREIVGIQAGEGWIWALSGDHAIAMIDTATGGTVLYDDYISRLGAGGVVRKNFFIDRDGDLWLYPAVGDMGTAYYNAESGKWVMLQATLTGTGDFVRGVTQDPEGMVWIATDHGGVYIYDKTSGRMSVQLRDMFDENSLSQNSTISLYCDDTGIVWVGTYKSGVSYYHPDMFKFNRPHGFSAITRELGSIDCNAICRDSSGYMWIGTDGSGLIRYDERTGKSRIFRHDPLDPRSISSDIVISLFTDHRGDLWIGTFLGGLNRYSGGDSFIRYEPDENDSNSLSNRSVYGISEDADRNLWLATLGGGINVLNPERKKFERYNTENTPGLFSNYFISTRRIRGGKLMLCSDVNITIADMERRVFRPFEPDVENDAVSGNLFNNVLEDSRGLFWVATNHWLGVFGPGGDRVAILNHADGLPGDEVVSLAEDAGHNIWAGTRNGIARIECSYGKGKLDCDITWFDSRDGLPGDVLNHNAMYADADGKIYAGTTLGFVGFYPDSITLNKAVPSPVFTELLIAGGQVLPGRPTNGGRVITERDISLLDRVVLRHNETNIVLRFSAMNFIHPEKNSYLYRLQGVDRDWITDETGSGQVSYSNLNPGKYRFVLYSSNNDGVWNSLPVTLDIDVLPPFWLSTVAIIIYALLVLGAIWWYLEFRLRKQSERFREKQLILEADKQHELDELKLRFFTNVSHEFKTPLTLILTPIEKMMADNSLEEQRGLLGMMQRNARNLLEMVNEILDFRKLDLNKVMFKPRSGDIIEFIRGICQSFSDLSADRGIKLTFTTYMESLRMDFDPEIVRKVVTNLLSNAFKYTKQGSIDISLGIVEFVEEGSSRYLSIKVADTGIGIAKEHLNTIFDRFYRIDDTPSNLQSSTGIGLNLVAEFVKLHKGDIRVTSEPGSGSTFTVYLPIEQAGVDTPIQDTETAVMEKAAGEEVKSAEDSKPLPDKNTPLLMIVDDNDDFREFTATLLDGDYRITGAPDGETGLKLMLEELPDLVLCDIMMPGIDGYEFCRRVRGDIRTSHVPIILLTAKSSEENKYLGLEAGADDYILKPFDIAMFRLRISKIIERQKRNHRNFKNKVEISTGTVEITSMDEKFVAKAVAIVEKNLRNPDFLVESLCREMGMSRVHFYKKILTLTDKTPSEFIRFIRLKQAAEFLEKSQLFVNEVAYQVGFNDPKYFRKYFKDEFGMTPNEYKKKFSDQG